MTARQLVFADEYLISTNPSEAYKAAYPNVKKDSVAAAAASRMLKNVNVAAYIEERMKEISDARIADAEEVMRYLSAVMRGESRSSVIASHGLGFDEVQKAPDEKEKLKAAELLGKRWQIFTDKVRHEGSVAVTIIDDLSGENENE